METDWNKLIERYLQNELSEEGKEAFEYELNTNPELKMEYDLHLMIMGSAVRSAERLEISTIGKRYHFRKKLTNAAVISGIVLTAVIATYLVLQNKKTIEPKQELAQKEIPVEVSEPEVADTTDEQIQIIPDFSVKRMINQTNINFDTPTVIGSIPSLSDDPEISKPKKEEKEEQKTPEEGKYRITIVRISQLSAKSSTREEKPFYLAGNYTWANDFMIMDTPEGLYMFDTTNNCLTVFKSNYRKHGSKYGEMVLFGFKNNKFLTDVYQNRIMYKGGNDLPVILKTKEKGRP